jgi:prepilin peptidase CpaA
MTASAYLSTSILIITSATLLWVAVTDFRKFKIRNEFILTLIGLYVLYAVVSGNWIEAHWHAALAGIILAILLYYYARSQIGGGDVKLLAVAFLWTGPQCAMLFALLLLFFIGAHTLAAKFGWTRIDRSEIGLRIPMAPSVAAALIFTFATGCLRPLA